MQTKKCPKCGAEIPVEMSFCLHCMERTDGVLEIKRKAVPSRKYVITAVIAFAVLLAAVILLILVIDGKGENSEDSGIIAPAETSTDSIENETYASIVTNETAQIEDSTTLPNFEEVFTERMNAWGATHVLTDTLSFTENGCTFTSNVGTDKVNCTVTANADMTEYTLTIEPYNDYTSYQTAVYIPDIVNEVTYFVLDYRMSSSMRTDIALMFENFYAEGHFSEDTLTCDVTTQAHNSGAYPITVNCRLD